MYGSMGAWLLVAVVFATLFVFWVVLHWTFNLIAEAHTRLRDADQLSDATGRKLRKGKGRSDF